MNAKYFIKGGFILPNLRPLDQCKKRMKPISRETRSITDTANSLKPQFKQTCSGFPRQPCSCYYPDHPKVPIFELSSDKITANASGVNGTGPSDCLDLKNMGNSLKGFYMVRFTNKRIKSIYCEFDAKMNDNTFAISETTISSKNNIQSASSDEIAQFCNDAVN